VARLTGREAIEALKEARFKLAFMKDQLQKVVALTEVGSLVQIKIKNIIREI